MFGALARGAVAAVAFGVVIKVLENTGALEKLTSLVEEKLTKLNDLVEAQQQSQNKGGM